MTSVVTERDARVRLPERYRSAWREPFERAIRERVGAGMTVLDIGSGRSPSLPAAARPRGIRWIGLDLSEHELRAAQPGSYDDILVGDVADPRDQLARSLDLAVSWQVLEHVRPLAQALDNVHEWLRNGGEFVSVFSGAWSAFAVANRILPDRLAAGTVDRAMRRSAGGRPVFRAHYDRCYASALERLLEPWSHVRIEPLYRGATYFHFCRPLQRAYLAYENAAMSRRLANLATHYFVVASK